MQAAQQMLDKKRNSMADVGGLSRLDTLKPELGAAPQAEINILPNKGGIVS